MVSQQQQHHHSHNRNSNHNGNNDNGEIENNTTTLTTTATTATTTTMKQNHTSSSSTSSGVDHQLPSSNDDDHPKDIQYSQQQTADEIVQRLIREGKISTVPEDGNKRTTLADVATKNQHLNEESTCNLEEHALSPSSLLLVVFKTVRMLDVLHRNHIVHRNLTLENIIIEQNENENDLNIHLDGLDKYVDMFSIESALNCDEHAGKTIPQKLYTFNNHIQTTLDYQAPETFNSQPFISLKSEIWSLAICILRVLFIKSVTIHPEHYIEQLDELFGMEDEDLASQDETKAIMTCLKEMIVNMLRPDVSERWSCSDVMDYICLASTLLPGFSQEALNY